MTLNTFVKAALTVVSISIAMPTFSAGYIKIGDIKGEATESSSQSRQSQAGNQLPNKLQRHASGPQASSITPEQAEELRKKIKDELKKPPCGQNSNTPC